MERFFEFLIDTVGRLVIYVAVMYGLFELYLWLIGSEGGIVW